MLGLVLLLAFWPHHHRKISPPTEAVEQIDPLESPVGGDPCILRYGLYEFDGLDGATDFSPWSCDAAYKNWLYQASPPKRYQI